MRRVVEKAKESPFALAASIVGTLATILGAGVLVDERYWHRAEATAAAADLSRQLETNRLWGEYGRLSLRKAMLEKSVYDQGYLAASSPNAKHDPAQAAALARDSAELAAVTASIQATTAAINHIKAKDADK